MIWLKLRIFIFHRGNIFAFGLKRLRITVKIVCTKYSIKNISRKEERSSIARYCSIYFLLACTDDIFRWNLQRYSDDTDILFETFILPSSIEFRGADASWEKTPFATLGNGGRELRVSALGGIFSKGTSCLWFWKRSGNTSNSRLHRQRERMREQNSKIAL